MKRELRYVCLIFVFLAVVFYWPAYDSERSAESMSVLLSAEEKREFADAMDRVYGRMKEEKTLLTIEENGGINRLLLEAAYGKPEEWEQINQELQRYGIFEMPITGIDEPTWSMDHNDFTVNPLRVYYRADQSDWYIVTGGYWNTEGYDDRKIVMDLEIGERERFGVVFTEADGYRSMVLESVGHLNDGVEKGETVTTYHRSDGDGGKGFSFELQDKYVHRGFASYSYLGDRWAGFCRYDSRFKDFSAVMTGYYAHTYSIAEMQSFVNEK